MVATMSNASDIVDYELFTADDIDTAAADDDLCGWSLALVDFPSSPHEFEILVGAPGTTAANRPGKVRHCRIGGADWLVGWLLGWLLGWLVGCLVGWLVVTHTRTHYICR